MKKKKQQVEQASTETAENVATKKNNGKLIVIIVAVMLSVALIITGIVLPFALSDEYVSEEGVNPYAVMKLSNGMTINYEIWEQDCPKTATNFIYLAEIGYFDGTVIFDRQNGYVRFGGWQENSEHRGDSNTEFLNKITDRVYKDRDYSGNKFGYRISNESKRSSYANTVGALAFCYERSATEFQFVSSENTSLTLAGDSDNNGWKSSVFGMASDDKSIANIKAIAALPMDESGEKFNHPYFKAPLDKDGLIKIESIKVRKKLDTKWKKFDFMEFARGDNAGVSTWSYTSKKTAGQR